MDKRCCVEGLWVIHPDAAQAAAASSYKGSQVVALMTRSARLLLASTTAHRLTTSPDSESGLVLA